MSDNVTILGAGLAGSEAALQLADRGFRVRLVEMRPGTPTPVHATGACAELVMMSSIPSKIAIKTSDVPKSGCFITNIKGTKA